MLIQLERELICNWKKAAFLSSNNLGKFETYENIIYSLTWFGV